MYDEYQEGPQGSTIVVRPKQTLELERRLVPGPFTYQWQDRTVENWAEYDTRYVGRHMVPGERIWIVGWWESYYGTIPEVEPLPLLTGHPFHHPWIELSEYGEARMQAQRKPLPTWWHRGAYYHAQGCWYAVEIGAERPSIAADLDQMLAALPIGKMQAPESTSLPDPRAVPHPDLYSLLKPPAQALLSLPLHVLGGLAKAKAPEQIRDWAWECASWIDSEPTPWATWLHGVCAYKHLLLSLDVAKHDAEEAE